MNEDNKSVLDTIYEQSQNFYQSSQPGFDFGSVNELTDEDIRKRRNKQLLISISVVVVLAATYLLWKKFKK